MLLEARAPQGIESGIKRQIGGWIGQSQKSIVRNQRNQNLIKMKLFVVLFAGLAMALAAPQNPADAQAQVLRYENDNIGVEGYNFNYETSNGIQQQEQGTLQNAGTENEVIQVRGSFTYTGPDGVTYTVTYIADENGFQPQGAHLPSK
ncbi:flexible cuticle protein 12-like [Rhynchophorus ferrugineus]|uniref:Flexible cuticle protein 12 n=1 Tax=Rhynchophorus ferrugineus TaxID=354439 RepID=A0A834M278_RHYFE|nr:hypothetical protein GWI33_017746 [Rhynchophorus ferrugineus]